MNLWGELIQLVVAEKASLFEYPELRRFHVDIQPTPGELDQNPAWHLRCPSYICHEYEMDMSLSKMCQHLLVLFQNTANVDFFAISPLPA